MKKNVKNRPEAIKTAAATAAVPEKSDLKKKKIKAAEVKENKGKKGKTATAKPVEKETKPAVLKKPVEKASKPDVLKKTAEKESKPAAPKKIASGKEAVKKKVTASKSKKAKTPRSGTKETRPVSLKVKEKVKETAPVITEEREMKMEVFFYDLTSLQKTRTDPKGTMLIAKFKQHEIGIHADPKLSNLMFSYYPKHGNGEMVNIPISIKDIISFISQKAE